MDINRQDDASTTREEAEAGEAAVVTDDAGQVDEGEDDEELEDEGDSLLLDEDESAPNLVPEEHPQRVLAGRIEILDKIGEGGMGAVWRGLHLKLQREVAVKILDETLQLRPDGRERFIREARALALLKHRNVATIYDCDEIPDGKLYLSMELLEGETLREIIKRREILDPLEVLDAGLQICDAVQAAHECGILHRDLTPSNIIRLRDTGKTIKVIDWGLCKYLDLYYVRSTKKYTTPPGARLVTPIGCRFGTPDYMAPEMIPRNNPGSPNFSTDVYALGVVLYELLTGNLPFARGDRKLPRPIRDVLPGFDYHDLEMALRAALRHRPEERTQTMAEFRDGLELARECLLAQRDQPAGDSAQPRVTPQVEVEPHGSAGLAGVPRLAKAAEAIAAEVGSRATDDAASATARNADSGPPEEPARVIAFRHRDGLRSAVVAAVLGLAAGAAGMFVAQREGEALPVRERSELLTRLEREQARASAAQSRAEHCEADAAKRAATPELQLPLPNLQTPSPPPQPTPKRQEAAVPVLATVSSGGPRRAAAPRTRPTTTTFSAAMERLAPKVRACARKGGLPDGPITVQLRRRDGVLDTVKVLKLTKDHPAATCIDDAIRKAALPPGERPVENFTFAE